LADVRERATLLSGSRRQRGQHVARDERLPSALRVRGPLSPDSVSELTVRVSDDGRDAAFANWPRGSRLGARASSASSRWVAATPSGT
jgi:hypothetical protein